MLINIPCKSCKKIQSVEMTYEEFEALRTGKGHIQDLLPRLTPDERELFISGICPKCWKDIFKNEEDEEHEN